MRKNDQRTTGAGGGGGERRRKALDIADRKLQYMSGRISCSCGQVKPIKII
jgi:hypothetical protein